MVDHCYAYEVDNGVDVKISNEHDKYQWLGYEEALEILEFEENKKVLSMLKESINREGNTYE